MLKLFKRTITFLKQKGVHYTKTITKIINHPLKVINQRNFSKTVLTLKNVEDRFTKIYKGRYWTCEESVSGPGSTFEYTAYLRSKLPELFKKFSIKTIFDAPCGDFNWMRYVLKENNLNYIGGDIVTPLIELNNLNYKNSATKFIHIDLILEKFPESDLMICRDFLLHLSFHDTKLVLENYINSNIPYLLTSTHINTVNFQNKDITTGDSRLIDLFASPYYFPEDVYFRISDWKAPYPKREMCLWTKQQIIDALKRFNNN